MHDWRLHAFALMNNHDHLFVETPGANLAAGMQFLNGSYTSWFNRRHERVGHLFQGRYKAVLIEDEGHFWEVSRYIHLNPVRARLTDRPERWAWSSYAGYFSPRRCLRWRARLLITNQALTPFAPRRRSGRAAAGGDGRDHDAARLIGWDSSASVWGESLARWRIQVWARSRSSSGRAMRKAQTSWRALSSHQALNLPAGIWPR